MSDSPITGNGDYTLALDSSCVDSASALPPALGNHPIDTQYVKHMGTTDRTTIGNAPDMGAFERE